MTVEEEATLIRYCLLVDDLGVPLSYEMAQEIAEELYKKSYKEKGMEFGEHWVVCFSHAIQS